MTIPKAVTVRQIQKLDRLAIDEYGIASIVLMENAGHSVAQEIVRELKNKKNAFVCVVCGVGNNAGDGLVIARHLYETNIKTKIYLIGDGKHLKEDPKINYRILKRLHYPIKEIRRINQNFIKDISYADIVVDAVFGVGLNRKIEGLFKNAIEMINQKAKRIVSVDVPSGLDGTTGEIYGVCIQAHKTITFTFAKQGFFKKQGPKHVGKIVVADIGIPENLKKKI